MGVDRVNSLLRYHERSNSRPPSDFGNVGMHVIGVIITQCTDVHHDTADN